MKSLLAELRKEAVELAEIGGEATLNHFKKTFQVEFKEDDSPVTNADREAEKLIREQINKRFPEHGIIGEEYGSENEDAEVVWILDPIDGTKSFIHGVPFYTTLIGITVGGKPSVGVIYAPALGEMVSAAVGLGCELNGKACSVRSCDDLGKATFLSTDVKSFEEYGYSEPYKELLNKTRIHRTWGDAYGHMMVATGRADIMIDPILNIWDAAALLPIVTEAGGSYSDLQGIESIQTGNAISTNKELKSELISLFNEK
jgi:histidinol-phosphatase